MEVEISVVVPALGPAGRTARAVQSALEQDFEAIEVLIVDDGGRDEAIEAGRRAAGSDRRVRIVRGASSANLAATRNAAMREAKGRWIALLDPGDEMAEARLGRLRALGLSCCADLVADNLVVLPPIGAGPERLLLRERASAPARQIVLAEFARLSNPLSEEPSIAALKPLIRTEFLRRFRLRYDERLPIGADYQFVAEALAFGARYFVTPLPGYRAHDRPAPETEPEGNPFAPLLRADDAFQRRHAGDLDRATQAALCERRRALEAASAIAELRAALAARRFGRVARCVFDRPGAAMRFADPAARDAVALAARAAHPL